jgi:hypothetical protein
LKSLVGAPGLETWDPLIKRQLDPLKNKTNFSNHAKFAALGIKTLHPKFKLRETPIATAVPVAR